MISKTMNAKLNGQITAEFSAAHKYLAMACAFEDMGLKILAKRFHQQADEERQHAMKILGYVHTVGGTVKLDAIAKPSGPSNSPESLVKAALKSELDITKKINDLAALADSEKDYATRGFLQWFVDEQVEEVATMNDLLALVQMAGANMLQVEARIRHEMGAGAS